MPARRLEDRIRELCARALYEKEPEWSATVHKLQLAIEEYVMRIANSSTGVPGTPLVERRQT
jgi:hypothetical protein